MISTIYWTELVKPLKSLYSEVEYLIGELHPFLLRPWIFLQNLEINHSNIDHTVLFKEMKISFVLNEINKKKKSPSFRQQLSQQAGLLETKRWQELNEF